MKLALHVVTFGLVGAMLAGCGTSRGAPPDDGTIAKITAATPEKAPATPQRKRKLLVFTLANGFRHSSIETGARALEILGQKTGAWETTVSESPTVFEPEVLATYDAVCFLNTTGDVFLPKNFKELPQTEQGTARQRGEKWQRSLLDFVASGKGFIGIHAATDTNYNWTGYGELIGGYFDGHPWGAGDAVSIRVEDPTHATCAHFEGKNLEFREEIYQMKAPYSRQKQRVVLGLDLNKTAPKAGMKRDDGDYPVSWVKAHGQGRVFYSSLGHREEIYWNKDVLRHYLAGIQFAMGDLPAETAPLSQPPRRKE